MRYSILVSAVLLSIATAARAQTIAPSAISTECDAVVAPSKNDLEPWLAGSAWAEALRFHVRAMHRKADAAFREKWDKVSAEISDSFATPGCNYEKVNGTLDARVFKAPPDTIPMDEDFSLPMPVAMAAADSACRSGDARQAVKWLRPAAVSGNSPALAALVVLESTWAPEVALARITEDAAQTSVEVALAGCVASIRTGKPGANWCARVNDVCDSRQCLRLQELVRRLQGNEPAPRGVPE